MTGQKKHLVYMAAVVLGGAALVVDRTILSDGASGPAKASASGSSSTTGSSRAVQAPIVEATPIPELHFPRSLPAIDVQSNIRDWFKPPASKLEKQQDQLSAQKELRDEKDPGGPLTCEEFIAAHRLDAVVGCAGWQVAIIDGRWVRAGESLDGCTFKQVSGRSVEFECVDGVAIMVLFEDLLTKTLEDKTSDKTEDDGGLSADDLAKVLGGK